MKARLENRRRWFQNEWFFKWHHIGKNDPVEIDSFVGSSICYGGIIYGGSARDVYWQTIVCGVKKEIEDQFIWVGQQLRFYNARSALQAIDESAELLISFVRTIKILAIENDRILRGDGVNFPRENDAGVWSGTTKEEITERGMALKRALPASFTNSRLSNGKSKRMSLVYARKKWDQHQGWLGPLGFFVTVFGVAWGIFVSL